MSELCQILPIAHPAPKRAHRGGKPTAAILYGWLGLRFQG
jgi:hypothetical protein